MPNAKGACEIEISQQVEASFKQRYPRGKVARVGDVITVGLSQGRRVRIEVGQTHLEAFVIQPSTPWMAKPVHSVERPLDRIEEAMHQVEVLVNIHNLVRWAFECG